MSGTSSHGEGESGRAPSTMSDNDLKALGNARYREKRFGEAVRAYRAAIDLSPRNAVYRSNLAACYFEMGRYDACVDESRRAIEIVREAMAARSDDAKLPDLLDKNRLRVAKALYFNGNFHECLAELSTLMSTHDVPKDVHDLHSSAQELAHHQAQNEAFAESMRIGCHRGLLNRLPRYRPNRITNMFEYYPVGHDDATSAMSGTLEEGDDEEDDRDDPNGLHLRRNGSTREDTRSALLLAEMDEGQLRNLSFFFGGVGDARHVFTTLLDVQRQMMSLTNDSEWPADDHPIWGHLRMHIVVNDIVMPIFARNLIVVHLLWELGAYTIDQATTVPDAIELAALIHYVFVGVVMPPYLYDRLMAVIDRLLAVPTPMEVLPFVRMSPDCWASLKETLRFWRRDPFVLSTKEMCNGHKPVSTEEMDSMSQHFNPDTRNQINANREEHRRLLTEQFEQFLTPDIMAKFANWDKDTILQQLVSTAANTSVAALSGCERETVFVIATKSLRPPAALDHRDPLVAKAFEAITADVTDPSRNPKLAKVACQHIYRTWKPNVTMVSPEWFALEGGCHFEHDPVAAVAQLYSMSWIKSPNKPESLFDWSVNFFAAVASCIRQLGLHDCLCYEFLPGDMNQTFGMIAIECETRRRLNLPVAFDRIFVSNIPDYTGTLPVFVETAPLLKRSPNAFIDCNILLNTGIFKDYDECVHSATSILSIRDCERYVGMTLKCGSLWRFDPRWGHAIGKPLPYDLNDLATQDELFEWVVRVILMIGVPPKRDPRNPVRENYPLNMSYLFRMFERLIAIGYPRHWLAAIMTRLLENRVVASARPPARSPNPCPSPGSKPKPSRVALDCFLTELRVLAALWQPVLRLAVKQQLPALADIHRYVMPNIQFIDGSAPAQWGYATSPILGVLFEPPSSQTSTSHRKVIEPERVTSSSSRVHMLTVSGFDSQAKELAVWLCRSDFAGMAASQYTIRLFESDGWTAVSAAQPVASMFDADSMIL
ncbi:DUF4470 domain-containing protein [Plasmodiophora brassicae]|uniref:DUF4470 domain-containing protein n=1 Tax=Plasmodiophora brassicae TaxID=37360 RepID=A0A0G4J7I1_PLABS|nr:hypothetical protein PBRA_003079 [Plasmodiophora brassicae]SPQ95559.1 unnamed protein product [Plasmodiophora brassicae]